jgi:DNA-binding CsgD family transcriptional regulator
VGEVIDGGTSTWAFAGRSAELSAATVALGERRGAIVFGEGGVGKSRLLAEVASSAAPGHRWHVIAGSAAIGDVAYGAWSHLLPDDAETDLGDVRGWRSLAAHLRAGEGPIRLLVEDAHWLDVGSATLLHHLVSTDQAVALVSSRPAVLASQPITALWKDGHLARIDLADLAAAEVEAMVEGALGAPVEPRTVARLHLRTGGNPLLVREVVEQGRRSGGLRLVHGAWVEETPSRPSPRLVDLLADRVDDLDPDDRAVAEVVAIASPMRAELLAGAVPSAALARLVASGLVQVDRDGLRRTTSMADPLMAEVLQERARPGRRHEVLQALVERMDDAPHLAGADEVRSVGWRLELGQSVPVDALLRAADLATAGSDWRGAERFATAAVAAGGGAPATIRLGEALMEEGQREAAEAVLAEVAPLLGDVDDRLRYRYASARALSLGRELGRLDDAIAVLEATIPLMADARSRWSLEAHLAFLLGDCGRLAAARPLAEARLAALEEDPASALTAMVPSALGRTVGGRCHDTLELCEAMFPIALAHVEERPEALGWVAAAQMLATYVDGDLRASEALCEAFEQLVADDPDPTLRAGILMSRGLALVEQGRLTSGLRLLQQAAALHELDNRRGYQSWTFAITAKAHAQRGELAEASEALEAAHRHVWPGGQAFDSDLHLASMWVAMLRGDRAGAVGALDVALERLRAEGMTTTEIGLRHEAVRMGLPARPHLDAMTALAEHEQSRWAQVQVAHVAALVDEDGAALVEVGRRFAELGNQLSAAEACAEAAAVHRRAGSMALAAQARQASEAALGRCEGAATPALRSNDRIVALTERELDVARLAARGASNQAVAAALGISVRTAETHLQRAFAKLGLHRRSELASVLGLSGTAPQRPA